MHWNERKEHFSMQSNRFFSWTETNWTNVLIGSARACMWCVFFDMKNKWCKKWRQLKSSNTERWWKKKTAAKIVGIAQLSTSKYLKLFSVSVSVILTSDKRTNYYMKFYRNCLSRRICGDRKEITSAMVTHSLLTSEKVNKFSTTFFACRFVQNSNAMKSWIPFLFVHSENDGHFSAHWSPQIYSTTNLFWFNLYQIMTIKEQHFIQREDSKLRLKCLALNPFHIFHFWFTQFNENFLYLFFFWLIFRLNRSHICHKQNNTPLK